MNKISILVVEDHQLYLKALLDLLNREEAYQVADVALTAEEGFQKLREASVDLVMVDIGLPRTDGITFVKQVHKLYPNLLCVMISGYLSTVYVQKSLQAGARGYLLKDNYAGMLEGIKRVINGEIYISKELGQVDFGFLQT